MGEVYRARDAKLGRDVALKVLPDELARDPERARRFEKEALAASALNHPNVVPDLRRRRTDGGTTWIAMELVEGATLARRWARGPCPQSASRPRDPDRGRPHPCPRGGHRPPGLEARERHGLEGRHVRILDFGLAKLFEVEEGDITDPQLRAETRAGTVVGTASYMSPEQAARPRRRLPLRPVLARHDAVRADDRTEALRSRDRPGNAHRDPPRRAAAPRPAPLRTTPAPLRWIIESGAWPRTRKERYASTADLLRELRGLRDHLSEASSLPSASRTRPEAMGSLGRPRPLALAPRSGRAPGSAPRPASPRPRRRSSSASPSARSARITQRAFRAGRADDPLLWRDRESDLRDVLDSSGQPRGSLGLPARARPSSALSTTGEMALSIPARRGWEYDGTLARASLGGGAPREVLENVKEADWAPDGRTQAIVRDVVGGRQRLEFPVGRPCCTRRPAGSAPFAFPRRATPSPSSIILFGDGMRAR